MPRPGEGTPGANQAPSGPPPARGGGGPPGQPPQGEATPEEMAAELDQLRRQLADTPVETVVANHCYGLFELAALHLSLDPPRLEAARLAIDALGCLVEGLSSRLGEQGPALEEGLAQIRLAFVQIQGSGTSPVGTP